MDHLVPKPGRWRLSKYLGCRPGATSQIKQVNVIQGFAVVHGAIATEDDVDVVCHAGTVEASSTGRSSTGAHGLPLQALCLQLMEAVRGGSAVAESAGQKGWLHGTPAAVVRQERALLGSDAAEDDEFRIVACNGVPPPGCWCCTFALQLCPLHLFNLEQVKVAIGLLVIASTMKVHSRVHGDGLRGTSGGGDVPMLLQVAH
mmetsp:Transcript_13462/g.32132  ORF Transcript_13462/g.32132 Transcript_13462/m.32132 type:complete len:202 (+) Transcript_13462:1177-1782(+)